MTRSVSGEASSILLGGRRGCSGEAKREGEGGGMAFLGVTDPVCIGIYFCWREGWGGTRRDEGGPGGGKRDVCCSQCDRFQHALAGTKF